MANNHVVFIVLLCLLNFTTMFSHFTNASRLYINNNNGANFPLHDADGTHAMLTLNDFDVGEPSECDGRLHPLPERVAALSTELYNHGAMCGRMIKIMAGNGRTSVAKVVDECDTRHGCKNNIVDASKTVWHDLGLNIDAGEVTITWIMA